MSDVGHHELQSTKQFSVHLGIHYKSLDEHEIYIYFVIMVEHAV